MALRSGLAVVVTGSAAEIPLGEAILAASGTGANFAGKLSVHGLAALLHRATLMVANSTGPLHVAVAVGTPVVGLFPQIPVMGPRRWGPYTDNARVLVPERPQDCHECTGKAGVRCACMASITVESVCAAAADLLAQTSLTERQHAHET
jgi:ADP-heptose:LPS heptosyltransferase